MLKQPRWEKSLHDLKLAEETLEQKKMKECSPPLEEELKSAFIELGKKLPEVWDQLSRIHKKSFLRCLIEKVVVHRKTRDCLEVRIVWQGGDTTTAPIPIPVGSFAELSTAKEMEKIIVERAQQNITDQEIASELTQLGYRSPMKKTVLVSTVQIIRLKHRIFRVRSQSHPTKVKEFLSVSQIAQKIGVAPYWLYDRINNGQIKISKSNVPKKFYLFPDSQKTITLFEGLKNGLFYNLDFSQEYQDA